MHLAAEAELGIGLGLDDAGLRFAQGGEHLLGAVADGGHDTHPRHDHAFHRIKILGGQRRYDQRISGTGGCGLARLEQADPKVLGRVDSLAVGLQPAVAGAEREFAPDHASQLDDIFELLHGRQHHA